MIYLRQSTASQEITIGPFLDDTDGKTAEPGLTISNTDLKIWKAGAITLASKNSGGATHISGGIYYAVLDATDTDTLGSGSIYCQVSGALPCVVRFTVLPANVFDSLVSGSDLLQVDTTQVGGTTATPTSDLATATALSAVGNNVTSMVTNGVQLSSTQSLYAPAKAGDAMALIEAYDAAKNAAPAGAEMALTSAYEAAKTAASATLVGQVKTVTDILNAMISGGAWISAAYANMPSVVGPGSRPVAIGPIYKTGTATPISGVEVTIYSESTLTSAPIDRKWSNLLGYANTYLNPGTYYLTMIRSDESFAGNPYSLTVPEA